MSKRKTRNLIVMLLFVAGIYALINLYIEKRYFEFISASSILISLLYTWYLKKQKKAGDK